MSNFPIILANRYANLSFEFRKNRFQVVDIQNATLSGGVAVGAIADLMLQPGGAFLIGTITGVVSAFGYRILQVPSHVKRLFDQIWYEYDTA